MTLMLMVLLSREAWGFGSCSWIGSSWSEGSGMFEIAALVLRAPYVFDDFPVSS
jgi:hypothetical protein